MATLSAAGIGSGLDIDGIINSLMAVEEIPLKKLQAKSGEYLAQISAYGQLRSAMAKFQGSMSQLKSVEGFNPIEARSSDSSVFTVSATEEAATESYSISVDFLAEAQKMGSTVQTDRDVTTIGNAGDRMTITIGEDDFSIDIGGKTLDQIKDAINQATDNVGVSASIIQESESGFYLSLTSDKTGTANAMTFAFTDVDDATITDPLGFAETQQAVDAQITIDDTYTITRSSNTITDAIEHVTIELLSTSVDGVKLDISRNSSSVSKSVEGFVDAYNDLRASLKGLGQGELEGDATLRMIENQIRSVMGSRVDVEGAYNYASQAGISFTREGDLAFDGQELASALENDLNAVADLFANDDQGFAFRLDALVGNMLQTSGLIDAREDGLNRRVDSTNSQIDSMELRLERAEARYRAQFTSLDVLLGQLQSTGEYVSSQLAALENLQQGIRDK